MISLRNALPFLVVVAACSDTSRMAMGDVNSIIVVADDSLWAEVQDTVLSTLQPRIFAVRDEQTFNLTHTSPYSENWADLRRFRQILAIGTPEAPWVQSALAQADTSVEPPAVVEANNVWARNQHVTTLVIPEQGAADAVRDRVAELQHLMDGRYRDWATSRMFISGHNEALADTLRSVGGFTLDIPQVYRWRRDTENTFVFLNDQPDASELVRWLTVTWRPLDESEPTAEALLEWRDSIASTLYDWEQQTQRDPIHEAAIEAPGAGGLEVRGVWTGTLDDFPQAGPFVARIVDCPAQDRRYLLDTWLYAPARDKYQYMIQLETLLERFRCGAE